MEKLNKWLTLLANIGVVVGIVVLVVEVRQNTLATRAASRDAAVGHSLNFFEQRLDNQVIGRAEYKLRLGEEIDGFERSQLTAHQYYNFLVFENIFTQYNEGVLTEEEWNKYKNIILVLWEQNEIVQEMWQSTPTHWTAEFRAQVNSLVAPK